MATIVDVTILGNRYKLKSSDNEAGQLEELAARLDARMQETASHLKRVNPLNVSIWQSSGRIWTGWKRSMLMSWHNAERSRQLRAENMLMSWQS